MSLNIERSNLLYRPKGNAKFGIRNSVFGIRIWFFSFPAIVGLVLLSNFQAIGQQQPDANVQPRAPKAEFVAPPSAQPAPPEPAPTPSILSTAPPKATDVLATASTKARADLDAALKELTATREKISSEKLPLSKKLSLAEDDLALARKELDLAQRARDMKNLDQSSLKAEIKQREEENTYMLNLLNEFGRNFGEKSIHISERSGHREKIDLAKAIQAWLWMHKAGWSKASLPRLARWFSSPPQMVQLRAGPRRPRDRRKRFSKVRSIRKSLALLSPP